MRLLALVAPAAALGPSRSNCPRGSIYRRRRRSVRRVRTSSRRPLGAPAANPVPDSPSAGRVYVVYGTASPARIDLIRLASRGIRIDPPTGFPTASFGMSVAALGDVDGDRRPDVGAGTFSGPGLALLLGKVAKKR